MLRSKDSVSVLPSLFIQHCTCLLYTSRFSLPVKLGNGKEEMELEILEEIIQQNYIKIF